MHTGFESYSCFGSSIRIYDSFGGDIPRITVAKLSALIYPLLPENDMEVEAAIVVSLNVDNPMPETQYVAVVMVGVLACTSGKNEMTCYEGRHLSTLLESEKLAEFSALCSSVTEAACGALRGYDNMVVHKMSLINVTGVYTECCVGPLKL